MDKFKSRELRKALASMQQNNSNMHLDERNKKKVSDNATYMTMMEDKRKTTALDNATYSDMMEDKRKTTALDNAAYSDMMESKRR